ncbi:MAG: RNA 2',3'-cyclic phosphodiesterase [bacterium]
MKKRLFIAINLPEEVKRQLSPLILELAKLNKRVAIKWVKSELIHLTLHFLGYLDQGKEEEVEKILENLCCQYRFATLKSSGLGAFPNLTSPRVIYLATKQTSGDDLGSLQREIGKYLANIGQEPERRAWQSHLTLGRVKAGGRVKLEPVEIPELSFKVESIELMESRLSSIGPEYYIVKSFPLG